MANHTNKKTVQCRDENLDIVLIISLLRTPQYFSPVIDADLRDLKLSCVKFNAMLVLASADKKGMLMNEIGRELVVSPANITGLIDRLERQDLVERCSHADRRATLVRLTSKGRKLLDTVLPRYSALAAELTECLEPAEKDHLIQLLAKLRREMRKRKKRGC